MVEWERADGEKKKVSLVGAVLLMLAWGQQRRSARGSPPGVLTGGESRGASGAGSCAIHDTPLSPGLAPGCVAQGTLCGDGRVLSDSTDPTCYPVAGGRGERRAGLLP